MVLITRSKVTVRGDRWHSSVITLVLTVRWLLLVAAFVTGIAVLSTACLWIGWLLWCG